MPVEIYIDQQEVNDALERLGKVPYAMQRAIYPAVSEMAQKVREHLAEYLTSEVPLPKHIARRAIGTSGVRTSSGGVSATVYVKSKAPVPLVYYDVKPLEVTARPGSRPSGWPGFSYSLRKGEERSGHERRLGLGLPFIARMPNGHLGVYFRTATQMKQAYGPSVQYHVADPKVEAELATGMQQEFPVVLERYIEQALEKYQGEA